MQQSVTVYKQLSKLYQLVDDCANYYIKPFKEADDILILL